MSTSSSAVNKLFLLSRVDMIISENVYYECKNGMNKKNIIPRIYLLIQNWLSVRLWSDLEQFLTDGPQKLEKTGEKAFKTAGVL